MSMGTLTPSDLSRLAKKIVAHGHIDARSDQKRRGKKHYEEQGPKQDKRRLPPHDVAAILPVHRER